MKLSDPNERPTIDTPPNIHLSNDPSLRNLYIFQIWTAIGIQMDKAKNLMEHFAASLQPQ